jgi:lipopolysaccharide transport system ATP-binding protein
MGNLAIRVENIGKKYHLGGQKERYLTLRDQIARWVRAPGRLFGYGKSSKEANEFWALKNVSFHIDHGEVVGIIGRNGAGKSTLLKILSRITEPTEGEIDLYGRVGSLLEVGTGFHPELSGRENTYLNGAILGMKRSEIAQKFDAIVQFAEIEKFIDTPVKHYSSGMYTRLAFAVAAHLDPEILVVDEVLAVGDAAFQDKCLGKMQEVAAGGRTVLFVSHNMPTLRRLTQRCVYLRSGQVVCFDPTPQAIDRYLSDTFQQNTSGNTRSLDYFRRGNTYESSVRFQSIQMTDEDGKPIDILSTGKPFRLEATLESQETHDRACLAFWLTNDRGERVSTFFSGDQECWFPIRPGKQTISCIVKDLSLSPGRYSITIGVNRTANTLAFDVLLDYPAFTVVFEGLDSGELDWPERPWGVVHCKNVAWKVN